MNTENWGTFANITMNETYSAASNNNAQTYEQLPAGVYDVRINRLWVHMSKKGFPTLTACFCVDSPNEFAGRKEYMNRILLRGDSKDNFRIKMVLRILHDFFPEEEIVFTNIATFADTVEELLDKTLGHSYTIVIDDSSKFRDYQVAEIHAPQEEAEEGLDSSMFETDNQAQVKEPDTDFNPFATDNSIPSLDEINNADESDQVPF